jgi:hypothetical protein
MTSAKREDGARAAKLRLVRPSGAPPDAAPGTASESELALERRHLRRALVARIVDEHERTVAKTGAPRASLVAPSQLAVEAAASPKLPRERSGLARHDEPHWPLRAALIVSAVSATAYAVWASVLGTEAPAATQLVRAALALPVICALAAATAFAVSALLAHRTARPATLSPAEREAQDLALELELALERRQIRRALAAKIAGEYRIDSTSVQAHDLRAALVNRDLAEEECDALDRLLAKARERSRGAE